MIRIPGVKANLHFSCLVNMKYVTKVLLPKRSPITLSRDVVNTFDSVESRNCFLREKRLEFVSRIRY